MTIVLSSASAAIRFAAATPSRTTGEVRSSEALLERHMSGAAALLHVQSFRLTLRVGRGKHDDVVVWLKGCAIAEAADGKVHIAPLVLQHRRHAHVWVQLGESKT